MGERSSYVNVARYINSSWLKNRKVSVKAYHSVVGVSRLPVMQFATNVLFLGNLVSLRAAERKLKALGLGGNRIYIYLLRSGRKCSLNMFSIVAWGIVFDLHWVVLLSHDCEILVDCGALVADKPNICFHLGAGWQFDGMNFYKDGIIFTDSIFNH